MPMKDGMPIPYEDGGVAVTEYKDKKTAETVARETGGFAIEEKDSKTGLPIYTVEYESASKGPSGDDDGYTDRGSSAASGKLPEVTRNMGGMVEDELGYMGGGVSYSDRGPIKYSKGGAVSGKNFKGSF